MIRRSRSWWMRERQFAVWLALAFSASHALAEPLAPGVDSARGRNVFTRTFESNRSGSSDGLGPVFNGRSCVSCHLQGGIGGGADNESNVTVLTAPTNATSHQKAKLHPGFVQHESVVLHHFSSNPKYADWRNQLLHHDDKPTPVDVPAAVAAFQRGMQRQAEGLNAIMTSSNPLGDPPVDELSDVPPRSRQSWGGQPDRKVVRSQPTGKIQVSQRNSTAIYGAGLIDSIPDLSIRDAARTQRVSSPQIAGRVAELRDGRIGRFGWHAQQPTLKDFALTACAVELGLNVPDHKQAGNPLRRTYQAAGLDLSAADCEALVAFLRALPRPIQRDNENPHAKLGRDLFDQIGCGTCHQPNLGGVEGLYSDLLLHDMGRELAAGPYGAFVAGAKPEHFARADNASEWRTPPLWGVASSAPYLHDGRAPTLDAAIRAHAGQGAKSAAEFAALTDLERQLVLVFLGSLIAPPTAEKVPADQPGWGAKPSDRNRSLNWGRGLMTGLGSRFD